ncbi:hypothetical protein AgCh_027499 [Apium graveolens]
MKQTTLVIRCVDVVSFPVVKDGYFLEFLNVENTSGLGLFGELEIALQSLDLNINDVRGQGYDTGSDMANSCVKASMIYAKELANKINIEPVFLIKRRIKRNRQFDDNPDTEREQQSTLENY